MTKIWYPVKIQFIFILHLWRYQGCQSHPQCLHNKQNITCLQVHTNFIFSCSTRYLTRSLHSLMRYRVQHSKTKFVSTCGHVISSIHKIIMYTYLNFAAGMSYLPPSPIVRNNKSYLYVEVIFNMRKHLLTALL